MSRSPQRFLEALAASCCAIVAMSALVACADLHARSKAPESSFDTEYTVDVGRYRLQSNPWVNLHQLLIGQAWFDEPAPSSISGDDLAQWKKAVDAYRGFMGKRSPLTDGELIRVNDALAQTTGSALPDSIPNPAAMVLEQVMPLYLSHQWEADDRANRFWIDVARPMLASAGEELARANSKAYGQPFPAHILVDVTTYAWEFGAYTVGEGDHAHAVIASIVPGNQGFAALEALVHEPSHAVVGRDSGAIGKDLDQASKELGVKPPPSLWHALLFYTAGETTRRALAERGVSDYRPVILAMYARGFGVFRAALEKHWQAYLDDQESRADAIRQIVLETAPAKKP